MNIELSGEVMTLKKVTVSAQKLSNTKSTQMGVQKIDIKTIKTGACCFWRVGSTEGFADAPRREIGRGIQYRFECSGTFRRSEPDIIQ